MCISASDCKFKICLLAWGQSARVTLLKKTDPPSPGSYQLWVASSSVRAGTSCTPPTSMLGFNLAWACTCFVCAVMTAVSSCVQVPCCAWEILLPCSDPPPLVLTLFLPPLPQGYLGIGMRTCDIDVSFEAGCSSACYSLHTCSGCLCYLPYTGIGASLIRVQRLNNLGI